VATPPFVTGFPGPTSVYIPTFNGSKMTANLVTSFARDPKKFAVNKIPTRTPTQVLSGYYMQLRPEVLARIFNDPNEALWVDGQRRPRGTHNQQDYRAMPYSCLRRAETIPLGWMTREQAVWDIQDAETQALAHRMMTRRALAMYSVLTNTNNHLATHVKTATQWSTIGGTGGFWSAGTSTNPIIKRSLLNIGNAIRMSTMDTVSYKDLTLIITPPMAIAMADSAEIHDYLARSVFAFKQIEGDDNQNGEWGLPPKLYGMDLIVDGTLRTTSARLVVPGVTTDIIDSNDNTAIVLTTPGAMGANVGQVNSSFSTIHMFVYRGQEMVVETHDPSNGFEKTTELSISETYGFTMVSPETAALVTSCFS